MPMTQARAARMLLNTMTKQEIDESGGSHQAADDVDFDRTTDWRICFNDGLEKLVWRDSRWELEDDNN